MRYASFRHLAAALASALCCTSSFGQLKTWDGRHSIDEIEVKVVYFTPSDREPLPDWRDRATYFAQRMTKFHDREFQGQSKLTAVVHDQPFRSKLDTKSLRAGDGDFTFFKTLREVDSELKFAREAKPAYPILLVLSEINWRPLDDFYRLQPTAEGPKFEGQLIKRRHFPGARSGGARATYLARQRKGWGLVSADGWRVPYSGSDCVAYHEGVGHTIGIPHPQPGNGSVMSLGQYRGWINESWLDVDQKEKLGWKRPEKPHARDDLFSRFTGVPDPPIPTPGKPVQLKLSWPDQAKLKSIRLRIQTQLPGAWRDVPTAIEADTPPKAIALGVFPKATPVSYRIQAALRDGQSVELWGYLQVRDKPNQPPVPDSPSPDLQLVPQ